jgi:hypothetical protein
MTCVDHATHIGGCMGCEQRWDRDEAERIAREDLVGYQAAALRMAIAQIDALTVARNADRTEWMTTYETLRAELEALRCNDLDAFHDGELPEVRAAAFRLHLASCSTCEVGLQDLMYIAMVASTNGDANG